jgi:DNA repair exonuclease SbcCD ATPase subunit
MEHHFLQVVNGRARPCTFQEKVWFEYWASHVASLEKKSQNKKADHRKKEREIESLQDDVNRLTQLVNERDKRIRELNSKVVELRQTLHDAHVAIKKIENRQSRTENEQVPLAAGQSEESWEICRRCGGAGGRCPSCLGNGWEKS